MTRGAKMFMLANNRDRSNRDGNREGRMNYEMQNGYGMESNYDMESRFRDRRGREHYDNGRFAPMRNEMRMGYDEPWSGVERTYDIDINRYEYETERPESRGGRMRMGDYDVESNGRGTQRRRPYNNGGERMRMIGFDRPENEMRMGGADASVPHYQEMDWMHGKKPMPGGAKSNMAPEFDENMAMEWTSMMENADGTTGPHWTMEQVKKVMEQHGLRYDPYEFWTVLNAIYSDDVAVAKKHGVNKMDYYVDRAVAWLEDKDAQDGKAGRYFEYIVKH